MEFINGIYTPTLLTRQIAERFPNFRFALESIDHTSEIDGIARAVKVTSPDLFNEIEVMLFIEQFAHANLQAAAAALQGLQDQAEQIAALRKEVRVSMVDDPREIFFFGHTNTDEKGTGISVPFTGNGYQTVNGIINPFTSTVHVPVGGTYRVQLRVALAFDGVNPNDAHDPVYVWVARQGKPDTISATRYTKLPILIFNPAGKLDINTPMLQTDDSLVTLGAGDVLSVLYATLHKTPTLYAMYTRELIVERIGE